MRENKIRTIWQAGGAVINGWLQIPSSYAAEVMAHQGFESLTIDMQHGPVDFQTAVAMLQAISTTDTMPLARVPWNDPAIIMKLLDAGCYGLICPMVNSRAEAEAFVGACRYPPHGYRSHGPNRVLLYAGEDYPAQANHTVLALAMIETKAAMDHLDDIMSTPHLDGVYVGPADLSQSLGYGPKVNFNAPYLQEATDLIAATAKKYGIAAGIHTGSPQEAQMLMAKGFQFITIQSDARYMAMQAQAVLTAVRQTNPTAQTSSSLY